VAVEVRHHLRQEAVLVGDGLAGGLCGRHAGLFFAGRGRGVALRRGARVWGCRRGLVVAGRNSTWWWGRPPASAGIRKKRLCVASTPATRRVGMNLSNAPELAVLLRIALPRLHASPAPLYIAPQSCNAADTAPPAAAEAIARAPSALPLLHRLETAHPTYACTLSRT
jgi:hypothetical protein